MMTILLILTSITSLIFLYLYIKAIKRINEYLKQPTPRKGYFDCYLTTTGDNNTKINARVSVTELERYKNDKSKIKLDNIDVEKIPSRVSKDDVIKYVETNFVSIMNTSDIIWLELDESLNDIRRKKLERLNKTWK